MNTNNLNYYVLWLYNHTTDAEQLLFLTATDYYSAEVKVKQRNLRDEFPGWSVGNPIFYGKVLCNGELERERRGIAGNGKNPLADKELSRFNIIPLDPEDMQIAKAEFTLIYAGR